MHTDGRLSTREASPEEDAFRYSVYASTRLEEMAAWNWDEMQRKAFLGMQFDLQQRSYRQSYPDARYRIVLLDDRAVGHILTADLGDRVILADLALLPAYRNRGIGSALIRRMQREAGQSGRSIQLHVMTTSAARRLYERLGFYSVDDNGVHAAMEWKGQPGKINSDHEVMRK